MKTIQNAIYQINSDNLKYQIRTKTKIDHTYLLSNNLKKNLKQQQQLQL